MKFLVLLGRIFYSVIFLKAGLGHFSKPTIEYAASQGVLMAEVLVPLSGIMALAGGLSVLVGYKAKLGAWVLILFLVPVTVLMHNFWGVPDPMAARMQQIMFMKNLSMIGAALLIAYFGAGPLSIDEKK